MRILFTGASSHTGYWFVKELVSAGHEVSIVLHRSVADYSGIRKERVQELIQLTTPLYDIIFGDNNFINLIKNSHWDLLCHHAAVVTDYRSYDFDAVDALKQNTNNLPNVLDALRSVGCNHVLLTGSVSEQNEGFGTIPLEAFTPYHLSKGATWDFFRFYTSTKNMHLGKFVLPNPFGPMEDPKFTTYLVQSWYKGEVPVVKTPLYIRDNIHVTLLAKAYRDFVEAFFNSIGVIKTNPSQYKCQQGEFAKHFALEMELRLNVPCGLSITNQTEFPEPLERVNTNELDQKRLNWDEKKAWDQLAQFYVDHYAPKTQTA